jgi:chitin disaccharide deacetylase
MTLRPLVLSADDYGLAPGVGAAIRELAAAGRLSATGCMTPSPFWPEEARALRPFSGRIDIGLHLTLTDHLPLTRPQRLAPGGRLPPLGRLMRLALARRLDPGEIEAELDAQLDAFEAAMGRPPDFVDGHQHVHQLPGVAPVLVGAWRRRLRGAWIRVCWDAPGRILRRRVAPARSLLIALLGARLRTAALRHAIPTNDGFAGVNDFDPAKPFGDLFRRFLAAPGPRHLVMCHPGRVDAALMAADPVTTRREQELAYLAGETFPADLAAAGFRLARLRGP